MALSSTIFKIDLALSDLDRHRYENVNLVVAQHPSETVERMMVRVLVYCLNIEPGLEFTRGLSTPDEPDLWAKTLDGRVNSWIEVGEPTFEKLKRATRLAGKVLVYSFNTKSSVWWAQEKKKMTSLSLEVFQFDYQAIEKLASLAQRTMTMTVTISADSAYVTTDQGECELSWVALQSRDS